MNWVRWHHGTSTDPKWRVIATKAQVSIAAVLAVWAIMLESASSNELERGTITGWNHEDVAAALDLEGDDIERIWNAMQDKVVANQRLTGWEKRNPKREDNSTERVNRYRQRVTHGNAKKRSVTRSNARGEEIRGEEKREEKLKTKDSSSPKAPKPKIAPKYPHYPTDVCTQLYDTYRRTRGSVSFAGFRKETAPLFPTNYAVDELIHALEAWSEWVGGLPADKATFQRATTWVSDIERWVRLGEMPLVDLNGVTERGRLAAGLAA